jgi:chromosome segregation ATPase
VEFKVEQATLRNELKKYKRSLIDAERNVARMAEEIKATKNSTDPSFVCPLDHGMSEEEAALLRQAQEEAEENKNEVMFAKKELDDLKRELWEAKREIQSLENGNPEDVAALESQVEELKGVNEDLDMEVKTLKEEVGQKDDEIVWLVEISLIIGLSARPTSGGEEETRRNEISKWTR